MKYFLSTRNPVCANTYTMKKIARDTSLGVQNWPEGATSRKLDCLQSAPASEGFERKGLSLGQLYLEYPFRVDSKTAEIESKLLSSISRIWSRAGLAQTTSLPRYQTIRSWQDSFRKRRKKSQSRREFKNSKKKSCKRIKARRCAWIEFMTISWNKKSWQAS